MTTTPLLQLPLITESQSSKFLTHNEALMLLETLIGSGITDKDLSAPPSNPTDGAAYIVAATPSGAWTGKENYIACRIDGDWFFIPPNINLRPLFVKDEQADYYWNGTTWTPRAYASVENYIPASRTLPNTKNIHNYDLVSTSNNYFRLSTNYTETQTLTGITDGYDGRRIVLLNEGPMAIVLFNQSTSSTAENRIRTDTNADFTMGVGSLVTLIYDGNINRWRVVDYTIATTGMTYKSRLTFEATNNYVFKTVNVSGTVNGLNLLGVNGIRLNATDTTTIHGMFAFTESIEGVLTERLYAGHIAYLYNSSTSHITFVHSSSNVNTEDNTKFIAATGADLVLVPGGIAIAIYDSLVNRWRIGVLGSGSSGSGSAIAVKNSGMTVGTRPKINFIPGTNVSLTIADDNTLDEVDVTISATGGGGVGSTQQTIINKTAAQSISPNISTKLQFNNSLVDDFSAWAVSTPTKLTVTSSGYYLILFRAYWSNNNANGQRNISINKNGTTEIAVTNEVYNGSYYAHISSSHYAQLDLNDYLEFFAYQDTSASINVYSAEVALIRLAGGGNSVTTVSHTTATLAPGAIENVSLPLGKSYELLNVATDFPSWVRVYLSTSDRTSDSSRTDAQDAADPDGIICEVKPRALRLSLNLSPRASAYYSTAPGNIPIAIANLDSVSRAITVTFTKITYEV